MRTPLQVIRIACDLCHAAPIEVHEVAGVSAEQLTAVLHASGWMTSRGRDICPACAPSFVPPERRS